MNIENENYNDYLVWLKERYNLTPEDKYMGVSEILTLKSLRDEHLGLYGETQLVQILKENGTFENQKKNWLKYSILTFDEYIINQKSKS